MEGRLHGIPNVLEEHTALRGHGLGQQGIMPRDSLRHDRALLLPGAGTAFNIGKEERDGSPWPRLHAALPPCPTTGASKYEWGAGRL
jgi:hypothetical protein